MADIVTIEKDFFEGKVFIYSNNPNVRFAKVIGGGYDLYINKNGGYRSACLFVDLGVQFALSPKDTKNFVVQMELQTNALGYVFKPSLMIIFVEDIDPRCIVRIINDETDTFLAINSGILSPDLLARSQDPNIQTVRLAKFFGHKPESLSLIPRVLYQLCR